MLACDRGQVQEHRDPRRLVIDQRDPLLEELHALAPPAELRELRLQGVEDTIVATVDRLGAAPCLDRSVRTTEPFGLDAAQLEEQLELLVLAGVTAVHTIADQLADRLGERRPGSLAALGLERDTPAGEVILDRYLDLVVQAVGAGRRALGRGARSRRHQVRERGVAGGDERGEIRDLPDGEAGVAPVRHDHRDRVHAHVHGQDEHARCAAAEELEEPIDEGFAGGERPDPRRPGRDRPFESWDRPREL